MIRAAAKESVAFQRQKWDEQEAKSLAVVTGRRREIVDVDKASFQAVMAPGVRQVHDHAGPEAPGQGRPGQQVSRPGAGRAPPARSARWPSPCRTRARCARRQAHVYTRLCAPCPRLSLMLAVVGLIAVILCVQYQVIGRYVFNDTPTWAEALALLLVLYVTALGVAVGVRDAGHIGLESLVSLLPAGLAAPHRAADPRAGGAVRRHHGRTAAGSGPP